MKRMTERLQSPRYFTFFRNLIALTAAVILFSAVNTEAADVNCDVSGDIPFRVTSSFTNKNWCFQCKGTWLRNTGSLFLNEEYNDCQYYAAEKTVFSPYGEWLCAVIQWDATQLDCSLSDIDSVTTIISSKHLCLTSTDVSAHFDIKVDGTFTTNLGEAPCASSATSHLGNNPKKKKRDTDEFIISGSEGDEAFIRLEADPTAGNNGGQLILRLEGDSLDEMVSGTMPLEITAVLPATGDYVVTVDQFKKSAIEGQVFRGAYNLTVDLPPNGIEVIRPAESTEE